VAEALPTCTTSAGRAPSLRVLCARAALGVVEGVETLTDRRMGAGCATSHAFWEVSRLAGDTDARCLRLQGPRHTFSQI